MPRWEFHLCFDEASNSTRWVWMYRPANGDAITSKTPFTTYGECIRDALLNGYSARGAQRFRGEAVDAGG